jgi:hypothetical protein
MESSLLPFLLALALAVSHLFAGALRFLRGVPRSRWLSFAGGVAVAYVFVHLLPELQAGQEEIRQSGSLGVQWLEHHVYVVALLGLSIFYGLERAAKSDRSRRAATNEYSDDGEDLAAHGGETSQKDEEEGDEASAWVFWLHMASYSVYNALIGYLLIRREEPDVRSLLFFAAAMGLHFLTNDYALREHHKETYDRLGRWMLAAAVLVGWGIGQMTEIDDAALAVIFAFLGGGIILNVLKEELPDERQSNFGAFASGVAVYTLLLLFV